MNFAPFNLLEFDGAFPQPTIASWLPTFPQPGRSTIYAKGTDFTTWFPASSGRITTKSVPDPWRGTSARTGPDSPRGTVIREPSGIVSSPWVFRYQAPPALPSNAGFSLKSVPDPWRATSGRVGPDPSRGTAVRTGVGTFTPPPPPPPPPPSAPVLSWQPTVVQPGRQTIRAAGTDLATAIWPYPSVAPLTWQPVMVQPSRAVINPPGTTFATSPAELIFADKWQPNLVQPTRPVLRASGTDFTTWLPDVVRADKWLPTFVQPGRPIVRAIGTDFVRPLQELVFADKWQPTFVQPARPVLRATGTNLAAPVYDEDTVPDLTVCNGRLTLVSGAPLGNGSGTTLYFTPFRGNKIGFNSGALLTFSETSIAIPAPTGVYDVFAYNSSGTMALEFSTVWTTSGDGTGADGTRASAISTSSTNGVYYKTSDTTRRYLGTIYSVAGTSYDVQGGIGTLGKRYVWNYYNRVRKFINTTESAANWSYGSGIWRALNNNTNALSSFKVVNGVSEDMIESMVLASTADATAGNVGGAQYGVSIGYDQNTANSSSYSAMGTVATGPKASLQGYNFATYNIQENIGLHTFWALEICIAGTANVYANGSGSEIHAIHWC